MFFAVFQYRQEHHYAFKYAYPRSAPHAYASPYMNFRGMLRPKVRRLRH